MTNREILFVVKLRNDARRALQGLSGDLRNSAKEAGRAAVAQREHGKALDGIQQKAREAAQAVQQLNKSQGGAVNPVNRSSKAWSGWGASLKSALKSAALMTASYLTLQAAMGGAVWLVEQGAAWQMMNAKIALVTKSSQEQAVVMDELYDLAIRNTTPMEATVQLYTRMARSMTQLGYSQQNVLDITDVVQKSLIISGATAQEAAGAMIQLSQAMASNRLGGEEFRSVMENAQRLTIALVEGIKKQRPELAKEYGLLISTTGKVSEATRELMVGSLKKMATDGLLTTDMVAKALLDEQKKITEEFYKLPMTASRAMTNIKTSAVREAGEIDKALNLNGGISVAMMFLANEVIPRLSDVLEPIGTMFEVIGNMASGVSSIFTGLGISGEAMGTAFTYALKAAMSLLLVFGGFKAASAGFALLVRGVQALVPAFISARAASLSFMGALAANPIGAVLTVVGLLIAAFMTFRNTTFELAGQTVSVGAIVAETWERVGQVVTSIYNDIAAVVGPIIDWMSRVWDAHCLLVMEAFRRVGEFIGSVWAWIQDAADKYLTPIFEFLAKIPAHFGNIIRLVFEGLARFFEGAVSMAADAADALDVFDQGWGDKMRSFSATGGDAIRNFGNGFGDLVQEMPSMVREGMGALADALPQVLAATPLGQITAIGGYLGEKFSDAFNDGTFISDVAARTEQEKTAQNNIDLTETNGNKLVNEPEDDKKKKAAADKAAKERAARIKEAVSALNSLTSAYSPYLATLAKDEEAENHLNTLRTLRTRSMAEFTEALGKAGLAAEDFNQLEWQVENHLKVDQAREFFSAYTKGYDELNVKTTEAIAKENAFVQSLMSAAAVGGQYYVEFLRQAGVTADQAAIAVDRFTRGLDNGAIDRAKTGIESLMSSYGQFATTQMENAARARDLNQLQAMQAQNAGAFKAALDDLGLTFDDYNRALERANILAESSKGGFATARAAAMQYVMDLEDSGMKMADVWGNAFKGMENALVSFVTTGKMDFKGMIDSMIADLMRLMVQQFIMKTITSAFGLPVGHSGGLAGAAGGDGGRKVHPAVFAGAKRYHTGGLAGGGGLRKGEVPVIAKKGEALLPTARMPDGNFGVKALIPEDMQGRGGGKMVNFAPVLNITVEGGGGNADEIGASVSNQTVKALEALVQRVLKDEMRSGGVLSGT